jgi:hypothetical protein
MHKIYFCGYPNEKPNFSHKVFLVWFNWHILFKNAAKNLEKECIALLVEGEICFKALWSKKIYFEKS